MSVYYIHGSHGYLHYIGIHYIQCIHDYTHLCICELAFVCVCLSVCVSVSVSVCLSICLSASQFSYLFVLHRANLVPHRPQSIIAYAHHLLLHRLLHAAFVDAMFAYTVTAQSCPSFPRSLLLGDHAAAEGAGAVADRRFVVAGRIATRHGGTEGAIKAAASGVRGLCLHRVRVVRLYRDCGAVNNVLCRESN